MNLKMLSSCLRGLLAVTLGTVVLTGCTTQKPDFNAPLPDGEVALRKLSPEEYPDFSKNMTNPDDLMRSCDMSIKYLQAGSSQPYYPYLTISHDCAIASVNALKAIVANQKAHPDPVYLNGIICQMFDVYKSKGAPNPPDEKPGYTEKVLFTGYFTPIYDASLTREGAYQYPLYKKPVDLVVDAATNEPRGRQTSAGLVPYYTRQQIESTNVLAGQELCYVKSRWEAYVITIQGSAKLKLPDGQAMEIGWDGYNGYDYVSPGEAMVADGVIKKDQHSSRGIKDYFQQNPGAMDKYLWKNNRYVFFKQTSGGPYGSLGVPVTPHASIAVDKKHDPKRNIYPRAMPAFLAVPIPVNETGVTTDYRGFMLDQDTGGAIRAAGRCDIYMGIGEQAEKVAGQQLHEGELYYIALKEKYIAQYMPPAPVKPIKAATQPVVAP